MNLYSYGPMVAGALPEWNKVTHPFGFMAENAVMEGAFALYISDGPFIYDTANGVIVPTEGAEVLRATWYTDKWSDFVLSDATELLVAKWCNVDILSDVGGLFLEASEPEQYFVPITITHHVTVDFMRMSMLETIHVMQGDKYSRNLCFTLLCGGVPWEVPTGTQVMVRFRRPTGARSNYSTMPDGGAASFFTDNTVTVKLAPQVMSKAGEVLLCISLESGETSINTFYIRIVVEENPGGTDYGIVFDGTLTLQSKTVYENGEVTPDAGYDALESVTVEVTPLLQEKTATENGYLTPDEGYYGLSRVKVAVSGGGVDAFNIAYGDTEPEDTSKLWVKTAEPTQVQVTAKVTAANEEVNSFIAALPENRMYAACAAVGTKIYVFGGQRAYNDFLDSILVFDTETKTVSMLDATLPKAIYYVAAAAVGTKIYIFGGRGADYSVENSIYEFDTETGALTTLDITMPTACYGLSAVAVGRRIYLLGGAYLYQSGTVYRTRAISYIQVFDADICEIFRLSTYLPKAIYCMAAAAVGTKIYLFGGKYVYDTTSEYMDTIHAFDTETNTISTLSATLPYALTYMPAAAVGTKIYLLGGYNEPAATVENTILVFDTQTQAVSTLEETLPVLSRYGVAATVGTRIYLLCGYTNSTFDLGVHELVTALPLAENTLLIEASYTDNSVALLSGVELGIANVYMGNAQGLAEKVAAAVYKDGAWVEI